MKIKKKLRDITEEELEKWFSYKCIRGGTNTLCTNCPFSLVYCSPISTPSEYLWLNHKEMFSDKFLNQEIEVEAPDILDDVEKKYLSSVIRPFKKCVNYIVKTSDTSRYNKEYIYIQLDEGHFSFPKFKTGTMYQGMELDRVYTSEELGLTEYGEISKNRK